MYILIERGKATWLQRLLILGGGKLHTTLSKKTINGGSAVVVSLPKCSMCVVSMATTWSDRWTRQPLGVTSGSATQTDYVGSNYSAMGFFTYAYENVAESTTIDFGVCPSRIDLHVSCIK